MTFKQLKQSSYARLYILGALLLLVAGGLWWNKVATDPQQVFSAMIAQSLQTSGVTLESAQTVNGTNAKQTVQYALGAQNMSHSITTLTQPGTVVTDEMIGTPGTDYTRYDSIQTTQKTQSGKALNPSKVIGVWAKSPTTGAGSNASLSQAILGTSLPLGGIVVPMGTLTPAQRATLLQEIKTDKVYQASYKNVQRKTVAGRLLYTYDVTIPPIGYVKLLRNFSHDIGLHDLDQVNPDSYKGQPDLHLRLTVDVRASHLAQVSLTQGQYSQSYTGYDEPVQVAVPKKAISVAQLQQLLQQMQL